MRNYYENDDGWAVGDRVKCFDSTAWAANGGDDEDDNSQFYNTGTITRVYREERCATNEGHKLRMLAQVTYDHGKYVATGKFLYGLERIEQ